MNEQGLDETVPSRGTRTPDELQAAGGPEPDLGTCCICEGTEGVFNVIMLEKRSPIAGRGWGCFQCGATSDGAIAVLCGPCLERYQRGHRRLRFACRGYPGVDGRIPFKELTGTHGHDMGRHPELRRAPR